jgi:hypothetical protein
MSTPFAFLGGAARHLVCDNLKAVASRRALFVAMERDALPPLPAAPFEFAEWRRCRVGCVTERGVEVFHNGVVAAVHVRNPLRHRRTTVPEHMPISRAPWPRSSSSVGRGSVLDAASTFTIASPDHAL